MNRIVETAVQEGLYQFRSGHGTRLYNEFLATKLREKKTMTRERFLSLLLTEEEREGKTEEEMFDLVFLGFARASAVYSGVAIFERALRMLVYSIPAPDDQEIKSDFIKQCESRNNDSH